MSTESETLHKVTNKDVRDTLHSVIESLIDGQEGFQKIGEHLKDETLRRYFAAESLKRASFRGELETMVHTQGDHDPKQSGSVSGTLRRTWGDLKAHLGGGDHTLLETAEAAEDAAKKAQASYDANRAAVESRDKYLKAEAASNRAAAKSRATTTTVTPELPASKQSTSG